VQNQTSPLILSFGVYDPVGAIGIQADLATYSAMGCHGLSVSTALLIGDTARVEDIQEIEPDWVSDQARVLLEDMAVDAIKIGALGGIEHVTAIAEIVSDYPDVPLILDPFITALPEQGLDSEDILMALRQLLIPQTTVLLLSQVELERLAETWRDANHEDTVQADVDYLLELGCEYVLLTGTPQVPGADSGQRANTLFSADGIIRHDPWQHLPGSFTGAGGTLSAAITALMARDDVDVPDAVQAAQDYTAGALAHAQRFGMGRLVPNRFFRLHPPQRQ
jgi:hydroxymethylpyrimidine/phosphomethylpyrimidine kinase